jgi:hypothetical protein
LDVEELPHITKPLSSAMAFVRTAEELVGHLMGGVSWK